MGMLEQLFNSSGKELEKEVANLSLCKPEFGICCTVDGVNEEAADSKMNM